MPVNLRGRHLITLKDYTPAEIRYLLDLSIDLKRKKRAGIRGNLLAGRNIVLLFEKASTRTRCAFEVAAFDEGAQVTFLTNSQMGKKESIRDTARVLGRMYDGIEFRGFQQATVEELAAHAGVPVWNGLTDLYHPTQGLADLMTLEEMIPKPLSRMKLAYVGDARNNMGNSLLIACAKMGIDFTAVAPRELFPESALVDEMRILGESTGSRIELSEDIPRGVAGADAVYTDVWVSMGEESQFAERIALLKPYQVTSELMAMSGNTETLFLHCLPAFHDQKTEIGRQIQADFSIESMEVTDEVFEGRNSVVFDQAENRMHTIKAVMCATIGNL